VKLRHYLERVGYAGKPAVDLASLRTLHRLHLQSIPYENLDVQFRRAVGIGIDRVYPKLVDAKRGGWCYEMNGLLGWALQQIGFDVTRVAAAVSRETLGENMQGNHLVLCVQLEQPYLADVGLGDGLLEPIPIAAGAYRQGHFVYKLEQLDDSWWRFRNHPQGGAQSFDFQLQPASQAQLADKCQWLQTAPESMFVQNALCLRLIDDRYAVLRGRSFKYMGGDAPDGKTTIDTAAEYREVLRSVFDLHFENVDALWTRVCIRHEEIMKQATKQP
jgi:N-hydroxyarylamine O-acetyltransferase